MSDETSLEEIAAEFLERREAGAPLTPEAFLAEHPEHADELRGLLELMLDMDKIGTAKTQIIPPESTAPFGAVGRVGKSQQRPHGLVTFFFIGRFFESCDHLTGQ